MNRIDIIKTIADFVKAKQLFETTGHDWWHTYRVWQTAKKLAQVEQADLFVVELAALLHDLQDWKFSNNNDHNQAQELLKQLEVEDPIINQVLEVIKGLSFKGAGVDSAMKSIEGKVVQDADRLDAIGAIGIARALAYGGFKGREIHNSEIKPQQHETFEQYKNSVGTTINHFYEKLFLLKDLMNTATAKKIALKRHEQMEQFLADFMEQWNGDDIG